MQTITADLTEAAKALGVERIPIVEFVPHGGVRSIPDVHGDLGPAALVQSGKRIRVAHDAAEWLLTYPRTEYRLSQVDPRPTTNEDILRWILAHELAHVLEYQSGRDLWAEALEYRQAVRREMRAAEIEGREYDHTRIPAEAEADRQAARIWPLVRLEAR